MENIRRVCVGGVGCWWIDGMAKVRQTVQGKPIPGNGYGQLGLKHTADDVLTDRTQIGHTNRIIGLACPAGG